MFETGRICMKVAGREAGRFCVIIGKEKEKDKGEEKDFVVVTGPKIVTKVRRRKCNVHHLEPTPVKIGIKENATDSEIMKAYEKNDIYKKLNLQKPTPEEIKLAEEAKERHKAKPREEKPKPEKKEEEKPERKEEKPREKKLEKPEPEKKERKAEKPKPKKEKKPKVKKKEAKPKKKESEHRGKVKKKVAKKKSKKKAKK